MSAPPATVSEADLAVLVLQYLQDNPGFGRAASAFQR